jgi:uncharacterized protein YndB with AHSA1/START domain
METCAHVHEETFDASPADVFALLHTPSAIRAWWGASQAIVMPEVGGTWAAVWGAEDDPDYVTVATLTEFDPPRRLVMSDYRYRAKTGPLPFEADFVTSFEVEPAEGGTRLRVTQDGFPTGEAGAEFLASCAVGWTDTFAGIRALLEGRAG